MTVLRVLCIPDERLRKIAEPVKEINKDVQRIIDDMFDTMNAENGIGLAATQIGVNQRIITIELPNGCENRLVLINSEIIEKNGEIKIEEGCLSIPKQRALIPRAEKVKIKAIDRFGVTFELEAKGILAVCIQHEMDHLIGKLFIDYLSPIKKKFIQRKVDKLNRLYKRRMQKL